jgi:plasmid stabilization system protein ParE
MELEVFWLQIAEDKLKDIHSYYKIKADSKTARKMVVGIVNKTTNINKNPLIGQKEELLIHRDQEFRYLIFKHYKIIYWINQNSKRIEIVNVFDTRQEPTKILETKTI